MTTRSLQALLLEALTTGPSHGTSLARRVAVMTAGAAAPHSYRVYQVLRAMVRDELIEPCEAARAPRRRAPRTYRLTAAGGGTWPPAPRDG